MPAAGFAHPGDKRKDQNKPIIIDRESPKDISAIDREILFEGRIKELKQLGSYLTKDSRPSLVTIRGMAGIGKTALACQAVKRFSWAWPGGIWAASLEHLPSREAFVSGLAHFLKNKAHFLADIDPQDLTDPGQIEQQVLVALAQRRTLIVLDNAETLDKAVREGDEAAVRLAQFIRWKLPKRTVTLLATSRSYLKWEGEEPCELEGLAEEEGANLFLQTTRVYGINPKDKDIRELSQKVEGNPFCLRLLANAFNPKNPQTKITSIPALIKEYQTILQEFEDRYELQKDPHWTLYACLKSSICSLGVELRILLSKLRIFKASFLSETAANIFVSESSIIPEQLHMLSQGSLLECKRGNFIYHLHPMVRIYAEKYMEQAPIDPSTQKRFGTVYAQLAHRIYTELDSNPDVVFIAQQAASDFDRALHVLMKKQRMLTYSTGDGFGRVR